jgi:hypothetical protein
LAGTLLHITLAERALARAALSNDINTLIRHHIRRFRLGAIFVDLPYYERLWLNGLRALAKRPIQFTTWGNELHVRSPSKLMLALLENARTDGDLAFALGALTHYAVDIIFHSEIENRIRTLGDQPQGHDHAHKQLEDEIDYNVHTALIGHRGMGTSYARRMLVLYPRGNWIRQARGAIARVHGRAPGRLKLISWQNNLAVFGLLSSTGASYGVFENRSIEPDLQEISRHLADEAIGLAGRYMETGLAYSQGRLDKAGFYNAVPNRSMLDGSQLSSSGG